MTRFPILAACLNGVPTDVIADSLSQGDSWALSDAEEAASALEIQLTAPVGSVATRLRALWQGRCAVTRTALPTDGPSVTADTITDEQIRELRDAMWAQATGAKTYEAALDGDVLYYHARVALGERRARRGGSRAMSRARCAVAWNARNARTGAAP